MDLQPVQTLDLRTTKCPLNFVKTKLALEKLSPGQVLEIWIQADSQSTLNIPNSIRQEGYDIAHIDESEPDVQKLSIIKH